MTTDQKADARANLVGSIFMVLAMAAFAIEDALIKSLTVTIPPAQVLVLFGLGGTLVFALIAVGQKQPIFTRAAIGRTMMLRGLFEVAGRLFYVLAIALTSLSSATVILQATPIVVIAGAAVFFGETVGWRRWAAVGVGLAGVMLILQPGTDGFSPLSFLAVLGMLGFAGRDLASRAAPSVLGTAVLGVYGFAAVTVAGVAYGLWNKTNFVWPQLGQYAALSGAVLAGVIAYSWLMKAMRTGDVSAVTPFRYTRLIFGVGIGVLFFDEHITALMAIGSALIVVAGLFILFRSNKTHE